MASFPPGTRVRLRSDDMAVLRFPPPREAELFIAVYRDALKALGSQLAWVVGVVGADLVWTGSADEAMLGQVPGSNRALRSELGKRLLTGSDLWTVVRPCELSTTAGPHLTVYHGDRPWITVGELRNGAFLAMPLNDARGNPKSSAPVVEQVDLQFPGSKRSQVGMAHLWSIPRSSTQTVGDVAPAPRVSLGKVIQRYFS